MSTPSDDLSQSSSHLKLFFFFFEHDNESTLLWDVEQGDSHYGCAADQTILEQLCDA